MTKDFTDGTYVFTPTSGVCYDLSFWNGDLVVPRHRQNASGEADIYAFGNADAPDLAFIRSFATALGAYTDRNVFYGPGVPLVFYVDTRTCGVLDLAAARKAVDTYATIWRGVRTIAMREIHGKPENPPEGSIVASCSMTSGGQGGVWPNPQDKFEVLTGTVDMTPIRVDDPLFYLGWMHEIGHAIVVVHTPGTYMEVRWPPYGFDERVVMALRWKATRNPGAWISTDTDTQK